MQAVLLTLVSSRRGIRGSLRTFNAAAQENGHLARSLLRYTRYWVYDSSSGGFGPSKFVGFRDMSFDKYARAREGHWSGDRFSGHLARVAIGRILGGYHRSSQLSARLVMWGQSLLGDDVFDDINRSKWMFTSP